MKKYILIAIIIVLIPSTYNLFLNKSYEKINYKIYNDYSQGSYDYSKRGYYVDTLYQPNSPFYYIITMGEQNTGGYSITISDIKIDKEKNVEVIVKETKPEGTVTMALTYPACCLELSLCPNSIIIKNTEGEVFKEIIK